MISKAGIIPTHLAKRNIKSKVFTMLALSSERKSSQLLELSKIGRKFIQLALA